MNYPFLNSDCHSSRLLLALQVFLFGLIIIGVGLLLSQQFWVPKLVDYILQKEVVFEASAREEQPEVPVVITPTKEECRPGGCSGQICTDQFDLVTTCEYKEEYACYQNAECKRQETGQCGWTETAELRTCLNNKSSSAM